MRYINSSVYCPDCKYPRIDIDYIAIRRESVGSMSNRCQSTALCYLRGQKHVPSKFLCEALIKISYFVISMYTCRRHALKALTKVLYFDLVLHDSLSLIFKTDVSNIFMKKCGHQLQVFANMIKQVLLKGRMRFTNTCCCVSVLCVLYGIQHADQCNIDNLSSYNPSIPSGNLTNLKMHQTNIPQCTMLYQKCAHVCTFLLQCGAMWDIRLVYWGICATGASDRYSSVHSISPSTIIYIRHIQ